MCRAQARSLHLPAFISYSLSPSKPYQFRYNYGMHIAFLLIDFFSSPGFSITVKVKQFHYWKIPQYTFIADIDFTTLSQRNSYYVWILLQSMLFMLAGGKKKKSKCYNTSFLTQQYTIKAIIIYWVYMKYPLLGQTLRTVKNNEVWFLAPGIYGSSLEVFSWAFLPDLFIEPLVILFWAHLKSSVSSS